MLDGRFAQERQLVAALSQGEIEREEEGAADQPGRDLRAHGSGTRRRAEDESTGDHQHVEDEDALEAGRVCRARAEIQREDDERGARERRRSCHPGEGEHARCTDGHGDRQPSRGNGAEALGRMMSVLAAIEDIVDQVHRARCCAEHRKASEGACARGRIEQLPAEHESRQHEDVLEPLLGPHRLEEREEALGPGGRGERYRTSVRETRRLCHRTKGKRTGAAVRRWSNDTAHPLGGQRSSARVGRIAA